MSINSSWQLPRMGQNPDPTNPFFHVFGNVESYTDAELIYGTSRSQYSPLLAAIQHGWHSEFEHIIGRVGKESLRLEILEAEGCRTTPLQQILKTKDQVWIAKAISIFSTDVLMEDVQITFDEIRYDLYVQRKLPHKESIPFLHYLFRTPKSNLKNQLIRSIFQMTPPEMLTTQILDGVYKGLTPVHMAFLTGNIKIIDFLMDLPLWPQYNQPAGPGDWEGYLPAHVYIQNHLCGKNCPNRTSIRYHHEQLLQSGPVVSGAREGFHPVHLALISFRPIHGLQEILTIENHQCLTDPIPEGKNAGITALSLALEINDPKINDYLNQYQPIEQHSLPQQNQPDPILVPQPAPNPIQINLNQWAVQKLAYVKRNPLPLIEGFKDQGLLDYSVYGNEFMRPNRLFPVWKNNATPEVSNHLESLNPHKYPEDVLEDVAGAVFQLHVALIHNAIGKNSREDTVKVPFLVYTQEAHEVRAHIMMSGFLSEPQLLIGLDARSAKRATLQTVEILGDSPYRFEEGQIVMDLEGFEKLTKHMAKPGLNLIMMPKMPDPEPQEDQPHRVTPVRPPRPLAPPAHPGTDEPPSMKRKPVADPQPPKRIRLTKSDFTPGGVDRRTALTDGAKTTNTGGEERISPPSKRQKPGKLEEVSMGKTVEMPEIAIDGSDPAFFLKNLLKDNLEGTLNNLKTAKARSALIQKEPLPMPIAEKLAEVVAVEEIRPLTCLKGYQMDALREILSLSKAGLMPLLSLEMGLGKTYVFREWILQQILAYKGGRHLIIVPASVKEQTKQVFQDGQRDLVQDIREIVRGHAPNDTGFTLEQLSAILRFPPASVLTPNRKEMKDALQKDHSILIINYEILDSLMACEGHDQFTSIVVDEAQRVHNDQSKTQNHLASLTRAQKLHQQFRQLMVTATPYENDLTELWTLLSASNPGFVPEESQKALTAGLQKVKENLVDSIDGGTIDVELLINVYAHYNAFKQILDKLVIYKKTTDPQVIHDWEGRVPTRQDENLEVELDPEVREALSDATKELIKTKSQLAFNAQSNAVLIHTSLIGQSIKDDSPAIQQLYQNAEQGNIQTLIEQSSFLKLLFGGQDPVLQRCYRDNMKALIFVDHYATGKLIQIGAKRIYQKHVQFFNGECTQQQKADLTDWFEVPNQPRVLVLTIKAGGVGLNLPSAKLVVDLSQDYNIAQHYQAIARAIRANNEGEVKVLRPLFKGSFYQAHVNAHQAKKALWMEFYFGNGSFDNFLEAIVIETKIDRLNKRKNLMLTLQDEAAMREKLTVAIGDINADQIKEAVALVSHEISAPVAAPPISLDPSQYFQIALPYGTPREDAIRLVKAFQNPEKNPLIAAFLGTKAEADKQRIPAEQIRRANPQALDNLASSSLRRALRIIDDRKHQFRDESLFAKDFQFRNDVQPPCYESADPDQLDEGVYLYKKPLPNGSFHYEPLIARDKSALNK